VDDERPAKRSERPAHVLTLGEVAAYVILAICLVLTLSIIFDWAAARFDLAFLKAGRRIDLASLLAIALGLGLTRWVGRWLRILPPPDRRV
jgi:hypothetical protein